MQRSRILESLRFSNVIEQNAEERKAKRMEIDRSELDMKSLEQKVVDTEKRLPEVKSNDEYSALVQQANRFKKERGEIEEKTIGLMDELQALEGAHGELEKELDDAKGSLTDEQTKLRAEVEEIRGEAQGLLTDRERVREPVDAEILETYDLLFSRYRDRSVVNVENGVCTGCHMSLNPGTIDELKRNRDIVRCMNCSRILYML